MNFATRMKQLKLENNITTKELADKLKVARTTVSNWENGNRNPDFDTLKRIASIFNATTDYLLGKSDIRNQEQSNKQPKQITDVEEAMKVILDQPGLMLKGELLSDESKIILANSILNGIKLAEELEALKRKEDEPKEGESID